MHPLETLPSEPDLAISLPASASDYYALKNTALNRSATDIHCIENGYLTVDYSHSWQFKFCIHDSDGNRVEGVHQLYDLPLSEHRIDNDSNVALIEDKFTKFNVCHFLLDKLYRVAELESQNVDSYVIFDANSYVQQVMDTLGYAVTNLEHADNKLVSYRFSRLYFSTSTFRYNHPCENFKQAGLRILEKLKQQCTHGVPTPQTARRLLIDRSDAPTRNIINQDEFHNVLERHGFENIKLESLGFKDQALAFNNVETVLGVHGAGLTNMLFNDNPDARMLEILPPLCATADYWKLSNALGFKYDGFIADDPEHDRPDYSNWEHQPAKYNRQNVCIDIPRFEAFLALNLPASGPCKISTAA